MAVFPSLTPAGRTFTPGQYAHAQIRTKSGLQARVRHSSAAAGAQLRLTFKAITRAELLEVRDHYAAQLGGFLAFEIPAEVVAGITTPATITLSGYRWLYASPPEVEDVPIESGSPLNRHDLTVVLEGVPAESSIAGGVFLRVRCSFAPGLALAPTILPVSTTFAPGAASSFVPGFAITMTPAWAPGAGPAGDPPAESDALFLAAAWDGSSPVFLYGGGL